MNAKLKWELLVKQRSNQKRIEKLFLGEKEMNKETEVLN